MSYYDYAWSFLVTPKPTLADQIKNFPDNLKHVARQDKDVQWTHHDMMLREIKNTKLKHRPTAREQLLQSIRDGVVLRKTTPNLRIYIPDAHDLFVLSIQDGMKLRNVVIQKRQVMPDRHDRYLASIRSGLRLRPVIPIPKLTYASAFTRNSTAMRVAMSLFPAPALALAPARQVMY